MLDKDKRLKYYIFVNYIPLVPGVQYCGGSAGAVRVLQPSEETYTRGPLRLSAHHTEYSLFLPLRSYSRD